MVMSKIFNIWAAKNILVECNIEPRHYSKQSPEEMGLPSEGDIFTKLH